MAMNESASDMTAKHNDKIFKDSGIINLYKPPEITSHKATRKVQKILKAFKAGHTGTLDPFAEGILLICVNDATRIAGYLSSLDKEYIVQFQLGITTDTYDITGNIIKKENAIKITREDVLKTLSTFVGEIPQEPPMYSALKVSGVPLYKLARKGISIARKKRMVSIFSIDLLDYSSPDVFIHVRCSKGTYIRTLIYDIGTALKVGAVVKRLKRNSIGHFSEDETVTFEDIKRGRFKLYTIDEALTQMKEITLQNKQFNLARQGTGFFTNEKVASGELLKLKEPSGKFFAIGKVQDKGYIKIEKVIGKS